MYRPSLANKVAFTDANKYQLLAILLLKISVLAQNVHICVILQNGQQWLTCPVAIFCGVPLITNVCFHTLGVLTPSRF